MGQTGVKDMDEWVLWGFTRRVPVPIKLTGGSLRHCRSEQKWYVLDKWTCAIYRKGTSPVGLRLQAGIGGE
jgi:hypothetical protein